MHPFAERWPRLWAFLESVGVLVTGGLLFWLFAIGVVTIPAAIIGLYAAVTGLIRPASGAPASRFWTGFRRSFGRALLLGLLDLAVGAILYADIRFFWSMDTPLSRGLAFSMGSLAALAVMVNSFAWPLLAWYPQPLGQLLKRSFLLAAAHPLLAVAAAAAPLAATALLFLLPPSLTGLVPLLGPGILATATGAIAWQAMKRYAAPGDEVVEP